MANVRRPRLAVLLVVFLALLALVTVGAFGFRAWRPPVATEEGEGIDRVITYLLWSTGALVLLGHAVLCWFLWRSASPAPMKRKYRKPDTRTETLWGVIPVLVMLVVAEFGVLAIAAPVWDSLYVEQPKDPLVVEVVGKQFEWFVRYPGKDGKFGRHDFKLVSSVDNPLGLDEKDPAAQDDVVKRGTLHLPAGRPVVATLRTHDVIHSFFVPEFRVKQDLIPGFPTRLKFTPVRKGDFELACAELCGMGHYTMRGTVHVGEPPEFEAWLAKQMTFGG
jgi:cytochrome c oxidase subunit 2